MARVDDFLTDRSTLTLVDLSNRKTHEANHNSRELIEILAEFRTARHRLVDHVGKFQPALFARSRLHPRLKQPMCSWIICILLRSTTTITWQESGKRSIRISRRRDDGRQSETSAKAPSLLATRCK